MPHVPGPGAAECLSSPRRARSAAAGWNENDEPGRRARLRRDSPVRPPSHCSGLAPASRLKDFLESPRPRRPRRRGRLLPSGAPAAPCRGGVARKASISLQASWSSRFGVQLRAGAELLRLVPVPAPSDMRSLK
jgi:hypothetical protein